MGFEGTVWAGSSSSEEESDRHQAKKMDENAVGLGRLYECMYCRRGFTNAQALGGHMNIHRKEKAKAKAKQQMAAGTARQSSLVSSNSREDLMISSTTQRSCYDEKLLLADQRAQYYEVPVGGQMSTRDFVSPGKENLGLFQEHGDLNLSMQIGHTHSDLGEIRSNSTWKESSEVDLELRLGLAL